jgi:hypothetical protein
MTDYYGDVLRSNPPNLPAEDSPNLSSIAKLHSVPDIVKLLRLVLAVAVKSDKKEEYVKTIYTLSAEAQKALMYLLQQVVSAEPAGYSPGGGLRLHLSFVIDIQRGRSNSIRAGNRRNFLRAGCH